MMQGIRHETYDANNSTLQRSKEGRRRRLHVCKDPNREEEEKEEDSTFAKIQIRKKKKKKMMMTIQTILTILNKSNTQFWTDTILDKNSFRSTKILIGNMKKQSSLCKILKKTI